VSSIRVAPRVRGCGAARGWRGLPFRRTARAGQQRRSVRASVPQDGPDCAAAFVGARFCSAGRAGQGNGVRRCELPFRRTARAGQRRPSWATAPELGNGVRQRRLPFCRTRSRRRATAVLKNTRRLLDSGRTGFSRSPSAPSVRSRIRRRGSLLADPHTEGERDVCDSAIEMSAVRPGDGRRDRRLAVRAVRRRLRLTVPPVGLEPTLERF
jgi:hypothetical protein